MSKQAKSLLLSGVLVLTASVAAAQSSPSPSGDPFAEPARIQPKSEPKNEPKKDPAPPAKPSAPSDAHKETQKDTAPAAKGLVDLRPKFLKGRELKYAMVIESVQNTDVWGKDFKDDPIRAEVSQELGLRFVCTQATESGGTIDLIFDRFSLSMTQGDLKTSFDSDEPASKDEGNPVASIIRPLVGAKLALTLDADGNITKIEGGEALAAASVGFGAELSDPARVRALFGPIFTAQKSPGRAEIGKSWSTSDSTDVAPFGSITISTDSTLTSHKGNIAKIDFKGDMSLAPQTETKALIGLEESIYTGSIDWNTELGMPESMKTTQKLGLSFAQDGVTQKVTNDIKMTLTRRR